MASFKMSRASVEEQPFAGSVTVSVYVPGASITGVGLMPPETMFPPLEAVHSKFRFGAPEPEPFSARLFRLQVKVSFNPASTVGGVVF